MHEETNDNSKTIYTYERHLKEYIAGTTQDVDQDLQELFKYMLSKTDQNPKIIEIGSGTGKDADYIESLGYNVQRTDAARSFVDFMNQKGSNAKQFNILTDDFNEKYDLIFAIGVLLHFTPNECENILTKIYDSLKPSGILAFTVKKGVGDHWTSQKMGDPRYFYYWQPKP